MRERGGGGCGGREAALRPYMALALAACTLNPKPEASISSTDLDSITTCSAACCPGPAHQLRRVFLWILSRPPTGWFLVGNGGRRYPISPYKYPLRDYTGYLIAPPFPTKNQWGKSERRRSKEVVLTREVIRPTPSNPYIQRKKGFRV